MEVPFSNRDEIIRAMAYGCNAEFFDVQILFGRCARSLLREKDALALYNASIAPDTKDEEHLFVHPSKISNKQWGKLLRQQSFEVQEVTGQKQHGSFWNLIALIEGVSQDRKGSGFDPNL